MVPYLLFLTLKLETDTMITHPFPRLGILLDMWLLKWLQRDPTEGSADAQCCQSWAQCHKTFYVRNLRIF